jgi:signal transduction histidine kinase
MRWWRDTLYTRLFLLMLVALLGSHLVAWLVITRWVMPNVMPVAESVAMRQDRPTSVARSATMPETPALPQTGPGAGAQGLPRPGMPTLGSLPPTPGLPGPPSLQAGHGTPTALPMVVLVLDYGIRILLIGLAAWWGSRWVSQPVRRMVRSARTLGEDVSRGLQPAPLDEQAGAAEVREAARVFNQMAKRLAQEFRARGLLMASISHDLRTPLTRMRIRLENLQPTAQAQRCVDDIREMNGLIDGAISVFSAEDPSAEPMQATDVFALVQSLVDDLEETGQSVPLHGHSLVAMARPVALRRAVSNLIGNALRYGGSAEVTVLSLGGARILVEDRGPGIPEELLEQVMQPFQRVDPSRNRDTGGTGLGLHIARSLLQSQGAELGLSNRPEGGLRVEIRLRAAPAK